MDLQYEKLLTFKSFIYIFSDQNVLHLGRVTMTVSLQFVALVSVVIF